MNKEEIRKEKARLKRQIHKTTIDESDLWFKLCRAELPMKCKFLKSWKDYLEGRNATEFLRISKNYGYLINLKQKEHIRISELVMPLQRKYNDLERIQKKLRR